MNKDGIILDRYLYLESRVIDWAKDKGILEKATTIGQAIKTTEEAVELLSAVNSNDRDAVIDSLGDLLVTMIIQAEMQQIDLQDCLESALEVIEQRTGKMVNGVFVKDK